MTGGGPLASLWRAEESLARADETSALLALLDAWRARRAPEIARVLQDLSARFERLRPAPSDKTQRARLVKWVEIARRLDPTDMAMLLSTFETEAKHGHADLVVPRLDELEKRADDPRPLPYLLDNLARPTVIGTRSRKVFLRLLRCIAAAGDPASVAPLQRALEAATSRQPQQYDRYLLRERGPKTIADLEARFPEGAPALEPAEREALGGIAAAIAKLPGPTLEAAPTAAPRRIEVEAELCAAVYRDPEDDGPRLVYADWLGQQGDSRGELIVLQVERAHGRSTPRTQRRENALIKEHRRALLGPLSTVVRTASAVFERGFLAACEAVIKKPAQAETELKHDAWGTVHTLRFEGPTRITAAMTALRDVHGVCDFGLRGLVERRRPRLHSLGIVLRDEGLAHGEPRSPGLRALASATTLPGLLRFSVIGSPREYAGGFRYRGPADWRWVFDAPFGASLRTFIVSQHLEQNGLAADWIAELCARAPSIRRLELDGPSVERIRLERDDATGRWSARVSVRYDHATYVSMYFHRVRGALTGASLERVVLESPVQLSEPQLESVMEDGAPLRKAGAEISVVVVPKV